MSTGGALSGRQATGRCADRLNFGRPRDACPGKVLRRGKSQAGCAFMLGLSTRTVSRAVARMKRGENDSPVAQSIMERDLQDDSRVFR